MTIDFNMPSLDAKALEYLRLSLESGDISGDGPFTMKCHERLEAYFGAPSLLTHSCTGALDMAALLANIAPGHEVIMPSYTFVSTANAFALRGATPVFVDVREDTLNLDERLIEQALTERTKAIVPTHYAGVGCDMDVILAIAADRNLLVIEDAAQTYGSKYKGRLLGTFGALGCISFHVSKNVVSGEGGALIVNDAQFLERAHIIREKGTNRTAFLNRKVGKYEWLDLGSSFLPSDLLAALLLSQLERGDSILKRRLSIWHRYQAAFEAPEREGRLRRPIVPPECSHNGHIYYILLPSAGASRVFRDNINARDIPCLTHYVPLHSAPAGRKFGRIATSMRVTDRAADTLVRLPIYPGLSDAAVEKIIAAVLDALPRGA